MTRHELVSLAQESLRSAARALAAAELYDVAAKVAEAIDAAGSVSHGELCGEPVGFVGVGHRRENGTEAHPAGEGEHRSETGATGELVAGPSRGVKAQASPLGTAHDDHTLSFAQEMRTEAR